MTDNELGAGGSYPVGEDWRRAAGGIPGRGGYPDPRRDVRGADHSRHGAGWGHSTPRQAVDLAAAAGCRRLMLFHHEPEHDDAALDRLLRETRAYAVARGNGLVVDAAAEGTEFVL